MYVCVCLAVTDVEVKAAIENGADHVGAVTSACKAGGDCGSCHEMIEDMIDTHARTSGCERRLPVVPNRSPREAA